MSATMMADVKSIVVVVASNYRQACMATEIEKLPPPDSRSRPGVPEVVIFVGPRDEHRIMGMIPDRIIFATPVLLFGHEATRLYQVRDEAEARGLRNNVKPEFVET
jgi:hypothetical protein